MLCRDITLRLTLVPAMPPSPPPVDPVTGAAHRQLLSEVRETLAALVGGEDRVHSGVRTAGYQFTADMVVYRRQDGGFTDTDGPRVTRSVARVTGSPGSGAWMMGPR